VANAVAGALLVHTNSALAAPADTVQIARTTHGGTTTTYMIGSRTLPLLMPLQQLGLPAQWVGTLNSALKPVVDAGYSRLTPDAGPYFSHGQLKGLFGPCAADQVPASAAESARIAAARPVRASPALNRSAAGSRPQPAASLASLRRPAGSHPGGPAAAGAASVRGGRLSAR
jgi:hypothetical protein